jgi:hypothetical protein
MMGIWITTAREITDINRRRFPWTVKKISKTPLKMRKTLFPPRTLSKAKSANNVASDASKAAYKVLEVGNQKAE